MKDYLCSIVKLNGVKAFINSLSRVQVHIYLCLKVTIYLVPSANEVNRGDWRMMADLLSINRASVDEALEGLTQNWIEGLLDVKVQDTVGKSKGYTVLEALYRCCLARFSLDEVWSE